MSAPSHRRIRQLIAYEDGSETPSLSVEFKGYLVVNVSCSDREANTFSISPKRGKELKDVMDEIQWGPIQNDDP